MDRLVYGVRPVLELLRARRRDVSLLLVAEDAAGGGLREVVEAARAADVAVEQQRRGALDAVAAGAVHQGVVAVVGEYPYAALDDLFAVAEARAERPFFVLLDGVQDPHNLGALTRSAHVFGAHGVVIPQDRAAPVTPAAVKASAGATEHTRIARVVNVARTLDELRERGLWIVGGVAEGGRPPWEVDLTEPVAVVVGGEGKGIRPLVLRSCDFLVRIPMAGKVAALNASAAGAVLLYETVRQRSVARAAGAQEVP
ncbi:MAG TPA: 23S rRNA (guanosine(2251)-2'-O)-methyltransferase RlmB [Polyangia bacterium]